MPTLSKSRFVSGVQCEKKLYFDLFRKDLKPELSEKQQALFSTGNFLGLMAQQVFPNGKDATPNEERTFAWSIAQTKEWMHEGVQTIYEATFSSDGGFAALDILHHHNGERWAIEVKGSGDEKPYHIIDASFQYLVMCESGYAPDKMFLMHINKDFEKNGPVLPSELFTLKDITEKVLANQEMVKEKKGSLLSILEQGKEPVCDIGKHCNSPFSCDYMHHCWKHIPDYSVFDLSNARGKDWNLYQRGIYTLDEIPEDEVLNIRQTIQVQGAKTNQSHIELDLIAEFLNSFQAPLYFFDFETIMPVVPILDGTIPFQQIPFQYSLHITNVLGEITNHKEFLAQASDFNSTLDEDPRLKLVLQMKEDIGSIGYIVAYNAPFEISRIKEMAAAFPEESEFLESLIPRFIDLILPFRKSWYYLPEMGASASIKSVLPAIAPNFAYSDLEINNGGMASDIFFSMVMGNFDGNEDETRSNLLKYCERDTEGMVVIYRHLLELVQTHRTKA